MAKQKTPTTLDPFTQWAHKSGRIFMIVFTVYMVVMPFIICTVYDCMPSFKMCLPGLISILVIMTPMSIAEIGSYTPILGSSSYLTFASGNLMNLKMPCIINAQKIAKVEQSTVEGDAIALIATAVSSSVTIVSWRWVCCCCPSSSQFWRTRPSKQPATIFCLHCSAA